MDSKCYELKPSVLAEIGRIFAAGDIAHVKLKLETAKFCWENSAPPPRIHIAVIWLSDGCRKTFECELEKAVHDWRDTLVNAGLAGKNWRSLLNEKNIDCLDW